MYCASGANISIVLWIPLCEEGLHPVKVLWPTAMEFTNGRDDWYTLLTEGQGLLIPNTWKTELGKLSFDGRFETSGGYMPWFGQVKERCVDRGKEKKVQKRKTISGSK